MNTYMSHRLLEDREIRDRFREYRQLLGSQPKAAKALGVSQPTISGWETGPGVPPLERRAQLAALVGEPLPYLIVHDDEGPDGPSDVWMRLEVIQRVAGGQVPRDVLRALATAPPEGGRDALDLAGDADAEEDDEREQGG